ncbi:MAG TPA: tRNA preQ1(34) S-adenosylmethionine ribosyltransferase-isomerase QueA [Nitrospirae bacterium]|nr:tRNA preQ1(34) S-adenosylmethionine ribosyltransferase-isomerase QueA [Nitrospirota bacterium]
MKLNSFDFELPEALIAREPVRKRDSSRLLVLKKDGSSEDRVFTDIKSYLREGDLLILNNSKVTPVKLSGKKTTGGKIDILLVKKAPDNSFSILSQGRYTGKAYFDGGVEAEIVEGSSARFNTGDVEDFIRRYGNMPLPPYIKRKPDKRDRSWYQTVYAAKEGSIAAPTAGLHFTEKLLKELGSMGVIIKKLTLHVGIGTFMPVKNPHIGNHRMEPEEFEVEPGLIDLIKKRRKAGGRIFAVGTTTTRTIESLMNGHYKDCRLKNAKPGPESGSGQALTGTGVQGSEKIRGTTDLFIYPGHRFRGVDCLITNFHLPKSTPLMLASAFADREKILTAYRKAIASGYRFFSYGDAMLIL